MKIASIVKNFSLGLLLSLIVIVNILYTHNVFIGIIFGSAFILFFGYIAGNYFFREYTFFWKIFFGIFFFLSTILIFGSIIYLSYQLNNFAIVFLIMSTGLLFLIVSAFNGKKNNFVTIFENSQRISLKTITLSACFIIFEAMAFFVLIKSSSTDAIRSPWQVVPKDFFILFFIATCLLFVISIYNKKSSYTLPLVCLHFFLTTSVVMIIYKLGYGFDPFIHQATEKIILSQGFITPKPLYYIGQYALVVFLSKILMMPAASIDAYLLPLSFSLYIPYTIYFSFKNIASSIFGVSALALSFLILPVASFIVTTPQGLANFYIIMMIFFSMNVVFGEKLSWIKYVALLALASLAIHPLTGIPALVFFIFLILFILYKKKILPYPYLQKLLIAEIFAIASIAIPIIFIVNSKISQGFGSYLKIDALRSLKKIFEPLSFLLPYLKNNFNIVYDIVYWYEFNLYIILLIFAFLGATVLIKKHKLRQTSIYIVSYIILLCNYIILRLMVSFPSLIDYEQKNYPNRIFEISFYFLMPLILYIILFSFVRAQKRKGLVMAMIILFLSIFITSSLYISYPRVDEYRIDKGYNITQADISAVHFVEENAEDNKIQDYIVLANQMTSVAAVKEFGFKKYYKDKTKKNIFYFYYPIPTGDPLYALYLDMVYEKPSKEIAKQAGDFMGVKDVYFILDSYWDRFDEIIEQAKQEANSWQSLEQGKSYVFYFNLNK